MARPIRFCPLCKLADDHPRHTRYDDDPNVARHMDCCRAAGCPDGSCPIVTEGGENLKGNDLVAYLTDPARQQAVQEKLNRRTEDEKHFTSAASPVELTGA